MRLSTTAADATVRAVSERMRWVQVMAGDALIARCQVRAFRVSGGVATVTDMDAGRAVRSGTPDGWRVTDAEGRLLMDGTVGAELVLPVARIDAGDEVRITSFRLAQR